MNALVDMLAYMAVGGLGAAVPYAIRSADPAELAIYQTVARRVMELRAAAKGAL